MENDKAITPFITVLEQHVEDLSSPGSCSCGWEKWDGTAEECRAAYRNHINAYLCESLNRGIALGERVRELLKQQRVAR